MDTGSRMDDLIYEEFKGNGKHGAAFGQAIG